jgi:hypothetical protein
MRYIFAIRLPVRLDIVWFQNQRNGFLLEQKTNAQKDIRTFLVGYDTKFMDANKSDQEVEQLASDGAELRNRLV